MCSALNRALGTRLCWLVPIACAAGLAGVARADDEPRGRWQGTSWGFELRGGAAFRTEDAAITPAPLLGLGVRFSTLLTLVDAELFATTAGFSRVVEAGRYDLRRTSIGVDLRLHPLFIRNLQGRLGDRIAAGVHLAIGAGADVLSVVGGEGPAARDRTEVGFAFAIGLGVDVPLTEPNDHPWSIWLGVGWRMRFVGFPGAPPGLRDMDEHQALVTFGVRFHDLSGLPLPVPPELDDVDR